MNAIAGIHFLLDTPTPKIYTFKSARGARLRAPRNLTRRNSNGKSHEEAREEGREEGRSQEKEKIIFLEEWIGKRGRLTSPFLFQEHPWRIGFLCIRNIPSPSLWRR